MPDVTKLIESEHREVEALFAQFKQNGADEALARQICEELDRHAAVEEQVFYPVVRAEVPGGDSLVSEGVEEHSEARQIIGRIKNTKDPEHLSELVAELEQAVNHHVQEEESELLPKTRETIEAGRLSELGREFEAANAEAR